MVWQAGRPTLVAHRIPDRESFVGTVDGAQFVIQHGPADHGFMRPVQPLYIRPAANAQLEFGGPPIGPHQAVPLRDLPVVFAIKGSVIAVVEDVTPYEEGGSMVPLLRAIDEAANAEDHLVLHGPLTATRQLANRYLEKAGKHLRFRPGGDQHIDHFLATRAPVRTLVIELELPLLDYETRMFANLLETDIRFVVLCADKPLLAFLPPVLQANPLEVPHWRIDDTAIEIAETLAKLHPGATLGAASVATLLYYSGRYGSRWNQLLEAAITNWDGVGELTLGTS